MSAKNGLNENVDERTGGFLPKKALQKMLCGDGPDRALVVVVYRDGVAIECERSIQLSMSKSHGGPTASVRVNYAIPCRIGIDSQIWEAAEGGSNLKRYILDRVQISEPQMLVHGLSSLSVDFNYGAGVYAEEELITIIKMRTPGRGIFEFASSAATDKVLGSRFTTSPAPRYPNQRYTAHADTIASYLYSHETTVWLGDKPAAPKEM